MSTLLAGEVVVMPTWVFLMLLLGGMVLIAFLLWANNTQADDLRRERHRRAVHNHLHHDGPEPRLFISLEGAPETWSKEMTASVVERIHREGGGQR